MNYKWRLMLFVLGLIVLSGCNTASQNETQRIKENPEVAVKPEMITVDSTPSPKPRDYSKSLEDLRVKFNRDKGKIRLVTLLSPT